MVVLVVHVFVAFSLIGLVLLQRGKGAEAGTGFGAGASGTVFGARGSANFLSRSTAILATLFFVTCLSLVYLSTQAPREQSLIERLESNRSTQQTVPQLEVRNEVDEVEQEAPPSPVVEGTDAPASGADAGDPADQ